MTVKQIFVAISATLILLAVTIYSQEPARITGPKKRQAEIKFDTVSKELKNEYPDIQWNSSRDKKAIVGAYKIIDEVAPSYTILAPDDSLKLGWKGLRTGDDPVPSNENFGPDEFLRYVLATRNTGGSLPDGVYVSVRAKLMQRHSSMSPEILEQDQQVVVMALPELRKRYKDAGFSEWEANDAAISTWFQVRVGRKAIPRNQPITDGELGSQELGRLVVISDPPEAAVIVDGQPWPDPTRTSAFTAAGKIKITLSKTGYETLVADFEVVALKSNEFKRTLKKKP
jgi:hypothetical protein